MKLSTTALTRDHFRLLVLGSKVPSRPVSYTTNRHYTSREKQIAMCILSDFEKSPHTHTHTHTHKKHAKKTHLSNVWTYRLCELAQLAWKKWNPTRKKTNSVLYKKRTYTRILAFHNIPYKCITIQKKFRIKNISCVKFNLLVFHQNTHLDHNMFCDCLFSGTIVWRQTVSTAIPAAHEVDQNSSIALKGASHNSRFCTRISHTAYSRFFVYPYWAS